ncbi:MAG: AAA family ATPase [Bdellovibrionales bacterium]|nr:AAA family ATPase [Bdellovibrionales bacterium]
MHRWIFVVLAFVVCRVGSSTTTTSVTCPERIALHVALTDTPNDADKIAALAWEVSAKGLNKLRERFHRMDSTLFDLSAHLLGESFAWLSGDPGGAKTLVCRQLIDAELRSFKEAEKRKFLLQFHKLISEGIITGFPVIQKMLDEGKWEIETSTSLVSERFAYAILDEIEKANPATLASLLSVLNERKAFLGGRVVDAFLLAGFSTSNLSVQELLDSFGTDRATGEALLDRFLTKRIVANQTASAVDDVLLLDALAKPTSESVLALHHLSRLLKRVQIPRAVLWNWVNVLWELDTQFSLLMERSLEARRANPREALSPYIPANQFSTRTQLALVRLTKARFLISQMVEGVEFEKIRWEMNNQDLVHLSTGAIYGAPGEIRPKSIPHTVAMRGRFGVVRPNVPVTISPYTGTITYRNLDDASISERLQVDLKSWTLDRPNVVAQPSEAQILVDIVKSHQGLPLSFEDDGYLATLLQSDTLGERARCELNAAQNDRNIFLSQLNAVLLNPGRFAPPKPAPPEPPLLSDIEKEQLAKWTDTEGRAVETAKPSLHELSWLQSKAFYDGMRRRFKNMEAFLRAIFVGILSDTNLFVAGPPGGAKTALLNAVYTAELLSLNEGLSEAEQRRLFFLQFHKMLPEGVITGFPKMQKQIDEGILEFDTSTSLVSPDNVFAILDEAEKTNPATLTTLLAPINEREVFAGTETRQTGLRSVAFTSNKTPAEFLSAFADAGGNGEPLLDRAIQKVHVGNKFATPRELFEFLWQMEHPAVLERSERLRLTPLRDLVRKVSIPRELQVMAAEIRREYLGKRLKAAELSINNHLESPRDYPYVYTPAMLPSSRSLVALMETWKSILIIQQLCSGAAYSDLRLQMRHEDLGLLVYGLAYYGPWETRSSALDGILQFELGGQIDKLLQAPHIDSRQKFSLTYIRDEVQEFIQIVNRRYRELAFQQRELVGQFPHLFPSLIIDRGSYDQWLLRSQMAEDPSGTGAPSP